MPKQKAFGFTLVELIVIIVLLSVIAGVTSSRFANTAAFQLQATRDDIVAGLFYAQQAAIARGTATNPIQFVASSDSITVQENGTDLASSGVYPLTLPNGMLLTPATPLAAATLRYDKLGRPHNEDGDNVATIFVLTDNTGTSATITAEATGYAH